MVRLFNSLSMLEFILYMVRTSRDEDDNQKCAEQKAVILRKYIEKNYLIRFFSEEEKKMVTEIENESQEKDGDDGNIQNFMSTGRTRTSLSIAFNKADSLSFFKKVKNEKRSSIALTQIKKFFLSLTL